MNSFENNNGHTQYPEGDGGAQGHDHPEQAGQDQALDGQVVGDCDQDGQTGQDPRPYQAAVARARVGGGRVKWVEFGNYEIDGYRTPEDQGAPEWHVF